MVTSVVRGCAANPFLISAPTQPRRRSTAPIVSSESMSGAESKALPPLPPESSIGSCSSALETETPRHRISMMPLRKRGSTFTVKHRDGRGGMRHLSAVAGVVLASQRRSSAGSSTTAPETTQFSGELRKEAALQAAERRETAAFDDRHRANMADAIQAFSVVSVLVLGFSVTSLVAVACELYPELIAGRKTTASFCVIMALAAAFSSYATVFFTMEIYYLKRLSDEIGAARCVMIETFMTFTGKWRKLARNATVLALACNLIAIAVLLWDFLPDGFAWAVAICMGTSAVVVVVTMLHLRNVTKICLHEGQMLLEDQALLQAQEAQSASACASPRGEWKGCGKEQSNHPGERRASTMDGHVHRDVDYSVPNPRRGSIIPHRRSIPHGPI